MDNRFALLSGDITPKSAAALIERLIELSILSSKPIILLINSEGGDQTQAIALYDFIRSLGNHVIGVVCGQALSSALLVFQACHERYLTQDSSIMLHLGTITLNGEYKYKELVTEIKTEKVSERIFRERIAERSGHSLKEIIKLEKKTTYLYADDALREGFADGIVTGSLWDLSNVKKRKSSGKK